MPQIYVDLDGVLADFDSHYIATIGPLPDRNDPHRDIDWKAVDDREFFFELPPMPDMWNLWEYVSKYDPIVLTGIPRLKERAERNKRAWVAKHIGPTVPVICCRSEDKYLHAKPGDILIDDWERYMHKWLGAGGRWVTHTSTENTITQLKLMGI